MQENKMKAKCPSGRKDHANRLHRQNLNYKTFYDATYKNMGRGGTTLADEIICLV